MSKASYLEKEKVIDAFRVHEKDTGSSEVQIAILTARIQHITEHLRVHKKDYHTRRGLIAMANRRRKLLDYLQEHNLSQYEAMLQRLKLRR
jgi:small subunit ribosomal protein S15